MKNLTLKILFATAVAVAINCLASIAHFRIDLTQEKRFTLSPVTQSFLDTLSSDVMITYYLGDGLNSGFSRLKKTVSETIDEMNAATHVEIMHLQTDPTDFSAEEEKAFAEALAQMGFGGVPVFETKEDGQKTRSVVYPYARVAVRDYEVWVNLLENIPGLSGEENLNRSIENLEYKLVDGLRRAATDYRPRIAFLEGHGELSEIDVVEATDALSAHFAVDRGAISDDALILDAYKVIIVAKPTEKFSEKDKYVLDQYAMRGGRILWLVEAVNMTLDSLRQQPQTIGLLADVNLDDMLFHYGVRVNPEVVEDLNCGVVPVSVARPGESSHIVPMQWTFAPLLTTNMLSPITRNVSLVRGDFVSHIDTVGENLQVTRTELLRTSQFTKVNATPVFATFASIHQKPNRAEYNRHNLCVGLLHEGVFASAFSHRRAPAGLRNAQPTLQVSEPTKMIFVADADIIRNDVRFRATDNPTIVPLGYDELSRQTFGNKDFIVNAVQYLADDAGWMQLRNRSFTLRLLSKEKIGQGTINQKIIAICLPLLVLLVCGASVIFLRKRKFAKKEQDI